MVDRILSGASRGIGRALALALAPGGSPGERLFVLARDGERLRALAQEIGDRAEVVPIVCDLSRVAEARSAGERLAAEVSSGAVLIHGAGVWPSRLQLVDGAEVAFGTHCLGPLALQAPLLAAGRLARVLVVGAGLMVKGRFHETDTPSGRDFSAFRTYASTKLAGAIAMRDAARHHPSVDFAVVHPGVVRTDLGDRQGLLGALLRLVKRGWESPEVCADRLVRLLERPRWERAAGEAPWLVEEVEQPWPPQVDRDEPAVLAAVARALAS